MPDIALNIRKLRSKLPDNIKLVAVSKMKTVSDILAAYNEGQRCFGENRVQELLNKKDLLPVDIEWHLIGHLQSNKVRAAIPFITMIESVDTYRLMTIINSEAAKIDRKIDCLLQIHIAKEETKFGFSLQELIELFELHGFMDLENVRICGLMGMATFTDDIVQVRREFGYLNSCYKSLKDRYFKDDPHFKEISMGMSDDYITAIEEGSTMIRIGSLIFGERNLSA